jgi:2,5-diketo-D-gluconate reductase A
MADATPTVTLNNGTAMPILGFGVYQVPEEQTEETVLHALEAGYRSLDTAAAYGNEEAVRRALAASLQRLGLDRVDPYLIHQPLGDYYAAWRAMQEANREGTAKAIGVSNFYPDRLIDLIAHNEVVPAVNQVETHPFFQRTAERPVRQPRPSARSARRTGSPWARSSCAGSPSATS